MAALVALTTKAACARQVFLVTMHLALCLQMPVARLKLEGIDGRAPPGSGAYGSMCLNTGNLIMSRQTKD